MKKTLSVMSWGQGTGKSIAQRRCGSSRGLLALGSIFLGLLSTVCGCGGDQVSFDGTWNGAFKTLSNQCPFSVASDINPLFPMQVSESSNGAIEVVAVDGSSGKGGQGDGETISFTVSAPTFGNIGSIAPYTCTETVAILGFLTTGETTADVNLSFSFSGCSSTPDDGTFDCTATYFGEARKVG